MSQQPEAIGGVPRLASASQVSSTHSLGSPFKPKVLQQILLFAYPTDAVVCLTAHWHIRLAASQQIYYHLAAPKNGALILKYPLCFANKDDLRYANGSHRYTSLMKHNIGLKYPDEDGIVSEFNKFLAGYKAVMLNKVSLVPTAYEDLSTLMIDLALPEELLLTTYCTVPCFNHGPGRKAYQYQPGHKEYGSSSRPKEMFMARQLWSNIIALILDQCAGGLKTLVFITPEGSGTLSALPKLFYESLTLDTPAIKSFETHVQLQYEGASEQRN